MKNYRTKSKINKITQTIMMKYMKVKFNLGDDLSVKKTLKLYHMVIVVISFFHEVNKYYLKVFLDYFLYNVAKKYCKRIFLQYSSVKIWQGKSSQKGILSCGKTILDVDADNIVISKLIEIKNNYKYLIEYLNEVMRPLVLILPKMNEYVTTFEK